MNRIRRAFIFSIFVILISQVGARKLEAQQLVPGDQIIERPVVTRTAGNFAGEIPVSVMPSLRIPVLIELTEESGAHAYARTLASEGAKGSKASDKLMIAAADAAGRSAITVATRQQERVLSQITSLGISTTPIYRVQRALNGIAVEVDTQDVPKLRALADVKRVMPIELEYPTSAPVAPPQSNAVPFMNVPTVWSMPLGSGHVDGTGVRIGIIDTGIDYIHPDFGGSGLLTDYQANDRTVAPDPFFPTAKVVGGTDFAGDAYTGDNMPVPDADPMDCNGHGSHVSGIAAGYGVTAAGATYTGPYDSATSYAGMRIQPGVAPNAQLYGIRIFGCGGSTALTVQGIDWAMDPNNDSDLSDHLDVINMSLGSSIGMLASTSAVAAEAAASIGMSVVISAGNDGDTFFVAGSPGIADGATTVAASLDDGFTAGNMVVNSPAGIAGSYVAGPNAAFGSSPPAGGTTGTLVQALDPADGSGPQTTDACSPLTNAAAIAGNVAFIDRGTCGFTLKVKNAQNAGAIGVVIANSSAGSFGPLGGADNTITIPSVLVTFTDGNTLRSNLGSTPNVTLFNGGDTLAPFSSRGPRTGSPAFGSPARVKPDVSAPGSNITSVQSGTTCNGTTTTGCITVNASGFIPDAQSLVLSGTSMACPQVTGISALMKQVHPDWSSEEIKAAIMNGSSHDVTTLAHGEGTKYAVSRTGAGRPDPPASAQTSSLAFNAEESGTVSVTFAEDVTSVASRSRKVRVENKGNAAVSYDLSIVTGVDAPGMSFSLPAGNTLTVPASTSTTLDVMWNVDPTLLKHTHDPSISLTQPAVAPLNTLGNPNRHWLTEESAFLIFSIAGVEKMRVPLYATSRPASAMSGSTITTGGAPTGSTTMVLSGSDACTGTLGAGPVCTGSFPTDEVSLVTPFELQVVSPPDPVDAPSYADIQYAGVAYDPVKDQIMFGISTWGDWGSPGDVSFSVYIDDDGNGVYDRVLFSGSTGAIDIGLFGVSTSPTDTMITAILNTATSLVSIGVAPYLNGDPGLLDNALPRNNTVILSATPAQLGLPAGTTAFKYKILTCPGFAPLCQEVSGFQFDQAVGPFTWNYAAAGQGLNFGGTHFAQDLSGSTLPVTWNTANFAANGSLGTLLLHTHNKVGQRAQVIPFNGATTADLGIATSVAPPTAIKGDNVTITVTATNNGPSAETGALVTVNIPAGMTYVSDDGGGAFNTSGHLWTVGSLANAGNATLRIIATLDSDEPQIVVAQIGGATPIDPSPANDLSSITFTPNRSANLALTESVSSPTVLVGGSVTYTYTVTNNGSDPAYSVDLSDSFVGSPGLNATSFVATTGVYNAPTHIWDLAGLDSGRSATLALTVTAPNQAGPLTSDGTAASSINDPDGTDNTASATTTVLSPAAITGTKAVTGQFFAGGTVTYTVVLSNSTSFDQQDNPGNEFTDVLPAALTLAGASASSGTATASVGTNTVVWNGAIPAHGSVTITITATVNAGASGTVSNQGSISFDADGNGTNESSGVTDDPSTGTANDPTSFTVTSPGTLSATKTVSGDFHVDGTVVYAVDIHNGGAGTQLDNPGDEFTDVLPAGLTLVSATAGSGTALADVAHNTVHWNGSIAAGGDVVITINATINATSLPRSTITNQGTVFFDADGNGTNESSATTSPAAGTSFDLEVPIPASSLLGLMALALALALAAGIALKRL